MWTWYSSLNLLLHLGLITSVLQLGVYYLYTSVVLTCLPPKLWPGSWSKEDTEKNKITQKNWVLEKNPAVLDHKCQINFTAQHATWLLQANLFVNCLALWHNRWTRKKSNTNTGDISPSMRAELDLLQSINQFPSFACVLRQSQWSK